MKVKLLLAVAMLGSMALAGSVDAQVRYSQPAYRGGNSRAVHYSRSAMGESHEWDGCSSGCGDCDSCRTGCGRCCRLGVLSWVARGVGCVADGIGSTLDCLFPGGGCCESSCCEPARCVRRPACAPRACVRRGCRGGCGERGCTDGCSDGADGHLMASPYDEGDELTPRKATPESSPPTPEPEAAKDARQYRPLPPSRASTSKPRGESSPRQPVKVARNATVPASAEEEIVTSPRAPRTLMVRPVEAKRLTPAYEEVEEDYEPVRAPSVRTATSRVPTNPLRSR